MQATIATATLVGVEGVPVEVQADVSSGLPVFGIVGLPDAAVQEARDRVRAALRSSGYDFPNARVIVNLAPAPLKKHGTGFDLPIALAILSATGQVASAAYRAVAAVGELGLDGSIRVVPGMLAHAVAASKANLDLLGPCAGSEIVGSVPGVRYRPLATIASARQIPGVRETGSYIDAEKALPDVDFADIAGHESAKRCLEIAAVGGHNMLFIGPPGSGKTMLARALCGILPPLAPPERLESALVYSVAGRDPRPALAGARPFRAPHHSCSMAGLIGGGTPPLPGEITLAHTGVLFLDELPEFGPAALQSLRQPMEEGSVTLVRANGAVRYPARVTLVAAMNPCPCGFNGDPFRECTCSPAQVSKYRSRIGGPLFDRMDISSVVNRIDPSLLLERPLGEEERTQVVRQRVCAAREFAAAERAGNSKSWLDRNSLHFLETAARRNQLSGRGITRVVRVARTIADLGASATVLEEHVAEALAYRTWDAA